MYFREPDKNRFINAINHVEQQEIPFAETEIHPFHIKTILGRNIPAGLRMAELPARDYIELIQRTSMDMAYLHVPWKLGRKEILGEDTIKHYVDGTIKSISDIDKFFEPDLDIIRKRLDEMLEAVEGTNIGLIYNIYNTPFISITAVGYEDYYVQLIHNPGFIEELFSRVDEVVERQLEIVLSYPIDVVMLTNILCMNTGPIMSREMMETYEYPYLRRHVKACCSKGIPVAYHCDGDNTSLCPEFIKIGIKALQAIEPCGNQDIYQLKKEYGDILSLWGNIDVSLLRDGTEEQVIADVQKHIEKLSPGGGYICASSHDIHEKIPIKNFWAMVKAIVHASV